MRIISSATCAEAKVKAAKYLANELSSPTSQGKDVLWLISGGSSIEVAVAAAAELELPESKRITIAQVDERYVPPGSSEENWQQLINAGLNPANFKQTVSMLSSGSQPTAIAENYSRLLKQFFSQAAVAIGLFGIGSDGHTAGIKPTEQKTFKRFRGSELVHGYQADDFQRITVTEAVIKQLDSVVAYACGDDKRAVVNQLNVDLPAHTQPAQLLKSVPTAVVFN